MSKKNIFLLTGLFLAAFLVRIPTEMNANVATLFPIAAIVLILYILSGHKKSAPPQKIPDVVLNKRKASARIPRTAPRRESPLISEAAGKLKSLRTMGELIRGTSLRGRIMEICDFADVVVETIRHMPSDTPSARAFVDTSLERFRESLDRCFELYRNKGGDDINSEKFEIECFGAFITLFRKHQESILCEGMSIEPAREPMADVPESLS